MTADDNGGLDSFKEDVDGNLWCGWGSSGAAGAKPEGLNGVKIFNKDGKAIGLIKLPERCPNLVFGGKKNASTWHPATRSTRFTSRPAAPSNRMTHHCRNHRGPEKFGPLAFCVDDLVTGEPCGVTSQCSADRNHCQHLQIMSPRRSLPASKRGLDRHGGRKFPRKINDRGKTTSRVAA